MYKANTLSVLLEASLSSEIEVSFGLVFQNLFDSFQDFRGQLLVDLNRLQVIIKLRFLGGTEQADRDIGVSQSPSKGQLSLAASKFLGDSTKTLESLVGFFLLFGREVSFEDALQQWVFRVESGSFRDGFVILAGQDTTSQWGPDSSTHLVVSEEEGIFLFESFSDHHGVLRLFNNGSDEAKSVTAGIGFSNSISRPFRSTPVEGLSVVDEIVEGSAGFFDGSGIIGSVAEDNIDVVQLESLEGVVAAFNDVLAGKTHVVNTSTTEEELGGDNDLFSGEIELLESLTEGDFTLALAVTFSSVEEVDTIVERLLDQFLGSFFSLGIIGGKPVTETEDGDLETSGAEESVFHFSLGGFSHGEIGRAHV